MTGAGAEARQYGRAAGLLSVGIGVAGLLTYFFFAICSHTLNREDYGEIVVLWAAVYITISTLFRPVEQLLSRTIAEHEAHGEPIGHALRVAAGIQLALAAAVAAAGFALREPLEQDLLSGSETLYWVMMAAVLAYAASIFARGFLAGRRMFGMLVWLIIADAVARVAFALAVAVGIAEGQDVVAIGVAAAPAFSLIVVPLAFGRRARRSEAIVRTGDATHGQLEFSLAHGGGFAAAVLLIMFSEQTFLNAGPLLVKGAEGAAAAGFIFNVLMLARAPLVLFQAAAATLLPHLTRLRARGGETGEEAFRVSVRVTLIAIVAFACVVALVVLAAGPDLMQLAFGKKFDYDREGLLIVTAGMGLYLCAATLNQAALARGQVRLAAGCWVASAFCFVAFNLLPVLDEFRRVEVGFAGGAALLCALLYGVYRSAAARPDDVVLPDSPQEIEARLAAADEAS